jgi:hypothetical protein
VQWYLAGALARVGALRLARGGDAAKIDVVWSLAQELVTGPVRSTEAALET